MKRNQVQYNLPLKILSYDELYGWTMDAIVEQIGKKNNCTFCGVFRRQALDRGAAMLDVDHIVTGHNADDIAETVLMNSECPALRVRAPPNFCLLRTVMRGDIARLGRCTLICTQGEDTIRRSKPFKYAYEKEIVMQGFTGFPFGKDPYTFCTQVCILQKVGLFLHRMHILSRCISRTCSNVLEGSRSC